MTGQGVRGVQRSGQAAWARRRSASFGLVERVAAVGDCSGGAVELLLQRDGGRRAMGVEQRRIACAERGEGVIGRLREREGGMGGEDGGVARTFRAGAVLGPGNWAVERIGAEDFLGDGDEGGAAEIKLGAAEIVRQAARPVGECSVTKLADEGGDGGDGEVAFIHHTG